MKYLLISCFLITSFFYFSPVSAQSWQWGRGGTGSGTDGWPVTTDPSGNVFYGATNFGGSSVVFGTYSVPFTGGFGLQAVVAKYNTAGVFQWAVGTQGGQACIVNIAADKYGNLFVLGSVNDATVQIGSVTLTNPIYPNIQYFVAKFDPSGTLLWAKNDGGNQGSFFTVYLMMGTTRICGAGAITVDTAGACYIASNYNTPTATVGPYTLTNAGPSSNDIIIAKYDPLGNVVWAKSAGGNADDAAYGITVTPAGNVYIAGVFASPSVTYGPSVISNSSGTDIAFIAEYNSSGSPVWASASGGTGGEYAAGLASDVNNNVYMTGGVLDNSISFSGTTITNPYPGNAVLYLVKFDPSNNVLWAKTIGAATDSAWGYCVATSTCGEIWVSGAFSGNISVDGHTIAAPPGYDEPVFIAGFNSAGTYVGSASLISGGDDQTGMACDGTGNIYLCSDYGSTPGRFVVASDTLADITAVGVYEWMYVAKYRASTISTPDTTYLSKDTVICDTGTFALYAPAGYTAYNWSDGSTGTSMNVHGIGTYWVFGQGTCSSPSIIDTFHVTVSKPDTTFIRSDTTVCNISSLLLTAPPGHTAYLWSDGSSGTQLAISAQGAYWVIASGTCTTPAVVDTFNVTFSNIDLSFSLGKDVSSCAPVELRVPVNDVAYLWQDGSTADTFMAMHTGTYYVKISKQGCYYADTINVSINNVALNLRDTTVCKEDFVKVTLNTNASQGASIRWSTGETTPQIVARDTGVYWVTVIDSPCIATDTARISSELCYCELYLPNAFTPNGDGRNDYYCPIVPGGCNVFDYHFAIYNRWGERVFYSENQDDKWDGMYKGIKADVDVYMYLLEYSSGLYKKQHTLKGDVTLVR